MQTILLDGNSLTRDHVIAIARSGAGVALDESQLARVQRAADFIADKVKCGEPIYGVTTGFGSNADKLLGAHRARDELPGGNPEAPDGTLLEELQHNLVITHAVCVGKPFAAEVVRAMLAIRINTLMRGHSGVRVSALRGLVKLLNRWHRAGHSGEGLRRRERRSGAVVASCDRPAGRRRSFFRRRTPAGRGGPQARRTLATQALIQGRTRAKQRHDADACVRGARARSARVAARNRRPRRGDDARWVRRTRQRIPRGRCTRCGRIRAR